MAEKFNAKDALADYVTVPQRIAQFYELFGQGRLVTGEVRVELGPDGKPRVMVQAAAYRTPDDTLPGIGWSWMELPGTTSFTRGSELENTETSVWGRAIAALGILVDRSVASVNEIKAKERPPVADAPLEHVEITGILSIGESTASDGKLRETPTGWTLGFNLTTGPRQWVRVTVIDDMALEIAKDNVHLRPGLPLKVWGAIEALEDHLKDRTIKFRRVTVERIVSDEWEYPKPGQTGPGLFDPATEAELDGALT